MVGKVHCNGMVLDKPREPCCQDVGSFLVKSQGKNCYQGLLTVVLKRIFTSPRECRKFYGPGETLEPFGGSVAEPRGSANNRDTLIRFSVSAAAGSLDNKDIIRVHFDLVAGIEDNSFAGSALDPLAAA